MKTLKQLLKQRGIKLVEVAKCTGIHIATLSKIQNGKQKPMDYQRDLLEKFFGEPFKYVTIEEILKAEVLRLRGENKKLQETSSKKDAIIDSYHEQLIHLRKSLLDSARSIETFDLDALFKGGE